ncbi:LysE family translocator [Jannaschia sp. M317]|uniref:LysE family translocator n=1 Tax=Jannaschia sp. M317 TaxID=2867011 RepID=UPI0021A37EF9|nr:LysE family translocator [Jannaschia sp. M317]UWQ16223.1 LysE family translocator [Jannaschia sp. M317]
MTFEIWATYAIAYTLLCLVPGPSVFMVLSQALSRGMPAALCCILGDMAGGLVVIAVAQLGLGFVLAQSALAFAMLKWAGVVYLVWLGLAQIRAARAPEPDELRAHAGDSMRAGFLTGVLNPKAILFYGAFLAQFIDPSAPVGPQLALLMATSTGIVGGVLGVYALAAARARRLLHSAAARRRMAYASGGFLIGGGALLATR